jgi:hypothetical protein
MDHKLIGLEGVDWIDLAQNRDKLRAVVKTLMKFRTT